MSIINKMLQDLDVRNGRAGGEALGGDAVRSVKPESRWQLGRNAVILIGVLVLGLAGAWWWQQRNAAATAAPAALPAKPAVALAAPVAPVAPIAALPVAAPAAPMASAAVPAPPTVLAPPAVLAQLAAAPPKALLTPVPPAVPAQKPGADAGRPAAASAPRSAVAAALAAPPPANAPNAADKPANAVPPPARPSTSAKPPVAGKTYTPGQQAANWLAEAVALDQQGRQEEAKAPLQRILAANPLDVPARQMLAQLLLDTHQAEAARVLLAEGQRLLPEQPEFSLTLARLKADGGDIKGAIQAMEAGRAATTEEPQTRAFLAALLLRAERYDEAVKHYLVALRSNPANTSWLVGVGVALEGVGKPVDAAEAYRRANDATNLTPEVARFLSERLARLGR